MTTVPIRLIFKLMQNGKTWVYLDLSDFRETSPDEYARGWRTARSHLEEFATYLWGKPDLRKRMGWNTTTSCLVVKRTIQAVELKLRFHGVDLVI